MSSTNLRFQEIAYSFKVILKAAKYLLSNPQKYHLIIIPLIINILLAILFFGLIFNLLLNLSNSLILYIDPSFGENFIYSVGNALSVVLAFLGSWFLITSVGIVIQSPFNSKIVENILHENGIENNIKLSGLKLIWYEISRSTKFELMKLSIIVIVFIITFFLNFIPVIGTFLYISINIINGFFLNLLDLLDPSYERIGISDKEEVKLTFKNLPNYLGVGTVAYFLWNIPIVNFIFMPLLFTTATFAFVKLHGISEKTK